jgi:hypothetical protein
MEWLLGKNRRRRQEGPFVKEERETMKFPLVVETKNFGSAILFVVDAEGKFAAQMMPHDDAEKAVELVTAANRGWLAGVSSEGEFGLRDLYARAREAHISMPETATDDAHARARKVLEVLEAEMRRRRLPVEGRIG